MNGVSPFEVAIPDESIRELTSKLASTRWVADSEHLDWAPGPPPSFVRSLCDYWAETFNWRNFENRINREKQVVTEIDGLRLHAIHRESGNQNAVPLILIHGWPGAFTEYLELCRPLAEPMSDQPAFHVVAPSLPGYGFSTTRHGVTPQKIAYYFVVLMERLGYKRFMVQGGNWGSLIGTEMARQYPERVIGLHLNSISGRPPEEEAEVSDEERSWIVDATSVPHMTLLSTKPATPAYALNDSPAGLASWIGEKLCDWTDNHGDDKPALSYDQMLGIIALYWFTGTIGSSMRLYYEFAHNPPEDRYVETPTAVALFPKSIARIPRSWAEHHYNIARWTVFDGGGHFPALEVPDILIRDVRQFAAEILSG